MEWLALLPAGIMLADQIFGNNNRNREMEIRRRDNQLDQVLEMARQAREDRRVEAVREELRWEEQRRRQAEERNRALQAEADRNKLCVGVFISVLLAFYLGSMCFSGSNHQPYHNYDEWPQPPIDSKHESFNDENFSETIHPRSTMPSSRQSSTMSGLVSAIFNIIFTFVTYAVPIAISCIFFNEVLNGNSQRDKEGARICLAIICIIFFIFGMQCLFYIIVGLLVILLVIGCVVS